MIIKECNIELFPIDSCHLRTGILLTLIGEGGKRAQGEIAPLPNHSKESTAQAVEQLQKLETFLLTRSWTKSSLNSLDHLGLFPSVHFGVESALYDLLDPLEESDPLYLSKFSPKVYGLLLGDEEEIFRRADEIEREGFQVAKVKLGHFTPKVAHRIVEKLLGRFRLRVDLNQKWELKKSCDFFSRYPPDTFDYIEEPSTDPLSLCNFSHPFALDESLRNSPEIIHSLFNPHLKAFIIKPTLLYPFDFLLRIGPQCVFSSSFESHCGIGQIKKMIYRLYLEKKLDQKVYPQEVYHGLDTLRYLQ